MNVIAEAIADRQSEIERLQAEIFVIRTDNELIVKRTLLDDEEGWMLSSDNTDKRAWPSQPWPSGAEPVGEVRWVWHTLP